MPYFVLYVKFILNYQFFINYYKFFILDTLKIYRKFYIVIINYTLIDLSILSFIKNIINIEINIFIPSNSYNQFRCFSKESRKNIPSHTIM